MPDIDIDLAPSKRPYIFKKIREKKGELKLLQVCTFGTEGARSAILTACRGYRSKEYPNGIDNDIGQYMTSLVPQERGFLWGISEVVFGNEEKGRKPVRAFLEEVNKYEGLLDIILSIEGLVNKRSQHASGVILYNEDCWKTNAVMRSPSGDLTTQFALHESEWLGDIKYDFLLTEISDKIINCIKLLQNDSYFNKEKSLRDIYNETLHPETIDLKNELLWENLSKGNVLDVFQFSTDVGLAIAKLIKPSNPMEMTACNALMRLMSEKGQERSMDRYARMKKDIGLWYKEMKARNISEEEVKILEPYYLPMYGTPCMQEDLMQVVMDKNISNFTLKESNDTRKIVAKKQMDRIPELQEKFFAACPNQNLALYVWDTVVRPQLGYAFSTLHSLAYSFVGIQTLVLASMFPSVYWNCACLITNSGGAETAEEDSLNISYFSEEEDDEDEEYEETDEKAKKKKNKTTNYGKIATAIGTMQQKGIAINPPDINDSAFTFKPIAETNRIIYGIKGINKIGDELVKEIILNRPYSSLEDFTSKVKINKPQIINLIKSGAFDSFGKTREEVMRKYIASISDQKKRLTLQNMQMLINFELIPEEYSFQIKVYNFTKYIRKFKKEEDYLLDEIAYAFYKDNYDEDNLSYINENQIIAKINIKTWDKIYKKEMEVIKDYLKENQEKLLIDLNNILLSEMWDKYCLGNISKWEMDSISFYYHEHELAKVSEELYKINNFFTLPEDPEVDEVLKIKHRDIPLYKLTKIMGTVLDKNKTKNSLSLLTKYGVVQVKIYQAQFAKYDKQISMKLPSGKKKVIEKSWFSRGNKLIITGIRRGDTFIPKIYKNSDEKNPIKLITEVADDQISVICERKEAN